MNVLRLLVGLLPPCRAKNRVMSLLGRSWSVDPTARVGISLFWRVATLEVGPRAAIGHLSTMRDMQAVRMGEDSYVGQLNWISGTASWVDADHPDASTLLMGAGSAFMSRHYVDCSGGVSLGDKSLVAGVRSTFLTHGMDVRTNVVGLSPIRIGASCLIGSAAVIQRGVSVADRVVIGTGAVVVRDLVEPEALYVGNPATLKASLQGSDYFDRASSHFRARDLIDLADGAA